MSNSRNYAIIGGIIAVIAVGTLLAATLEDREDGGPMPTGNNTGNGSTHDIAGNGSTHDITPDIQQILDDIEDRARDAENLETDYDADRKREWITSGPFQIDRSEYALGENIFLRIGQLQPHEKGQVAFLRPLNGTHYSVYMTIPFDGTQQPFNQYFTPDVSRAQQICSADDLAGEWSVVFRGTDYESLTFTLSDSVFVPGEESRFDPVC